MQNKSDKKRKLYYRKGKFSQLLSVEYRQDLSLYHFFYSILFSSEVVHLLTLKIGREEEFKVSV
jgi:hypothetical protein